jgi:hypothetical protein
MANAIAAGNLNDGRLQLWSVNGDGSMVTRWKTSTGPGSGWTGWSPFQSPPGGAVTIATGQVGGGILQLFSTNAEGTFTSFEVTQPAGWTPWSAF